MSTDAIQYRAISVDGTVTDIDDRKHQARVEFPHGVTDSFQTEFLPGCWSASFARRKPAFGPSIRHFTPVWDHFETHYSTPIQRPAERGLSDGCLPWSWAWLAGEGSNLQHPAPKAGVLPIELPAKRRCGRPPVGCHASINSIRFPKGSST